MLYRGVGVGLWNPILHLRKLGHTLKLDQTLKVGWLGHLYESVTVRQTFDPATSVSVQYNIMEYLSLFKSEFDQTLTHISFWIQTFFNENLTKFYCGQQII